MISDLNRCDKACFGCIKNYKTKHSLKSGQKFEIRCNGIPKDHIPPAILDTIRPEERNMAQSLLDPVTWAAQTLDWHCLDPDGSVWKRRNPDEYYAWIEANPGVDILGHSRYHRPYQADMLRCTSKRKVFRIGRQAGKTESLVISMLFSMFTKPSVPDTEGFKIVVITPYQSQIELIFTRMNELINSSSLTQNSLKRYVKAPMYTMELYNGSTVRGFTAGTKSGGNAEAVRGQHAHMLVFDEADYLSSGDMDAAMAIITNYPTATVWMSSTPSGKREMFYENCHSKRYKEFHFPSSCNPLWNDDLEGDFREALTEIGYVHECDADFGEMEQGVFQHAYIEAAKEDYKYGEIAPNHRWTYALGVDWNDTKIGTTINVLGFHPDKRIFYIVDREVVSRDGWTQLSACSRIADLNRIWKPMAIYVDRGYGGTQVEVLRNFGYEALADPSKGPTHPDAALRDIVKPYDFGSSIEVRDLFTKQPVKKNAKGFLVESTVRRFESNDIRFSEYDEDLEAQLGNYIIDRITTTGNAVFKADNEDIGDHALDALMLSVLAFVMEVSPLGRPKYTSQIEFSGRFGEKTEMEVHEGDLVVKPDKKQSTKRLRDKIRPEPRDMQQQSLFDSSTELPANHTNHNTVKPWSYEGFLSDGPKPEVRTLGEASQQARNRLGLSPRRGGRPTRKNI